MNEMNDFFPNEIEVTAMICSLQYAHTHGCCGYNDCCLIVVPCFARDDVM